MVIIFLASLLSLLLHLYLFGFTPGGDGPGWLSLSRYLLGQVDGGQVWFHRFFTPIYGLIGTVLPFWVINFSCLVINSFLFYKLTKKLTGDDYLSFWSTILFTFDFQNLRQTMMITPDGLAWTAMLIVLIYALTSPGPVIWGLLLSIATLIKTNLGFFFPIFPLLLIIGKDRQLLLKTLVASLIYLIIVGDYFLGMYFIFHKTILDSAIDLKAKVATPISAYFLEFLPAFLYYWPFVFVGLLKNPFKNPKIITAFFVLTLTPLLVWTGAAARYHFTLFWFFIPLAAAGIIYLFKKKIIIVVVLGIFILGLFRQQMTLNHQTHAEFFRSLLKANNFIAE